MAHILTRKYGSGNTRYTAVIRIRRGPTGAVMVHREAKTFAHRSAALTWARHREVQLEDDAELTKAVQSSQQDEADITLAALIRWYIDTFESISKWQRSKQTHLEFLERHPFSANVALRLNVSQLVNHIKARRADGAGPATVCNDLIWIGVVLRAAKSVKGLPVQPSIVQEARTACRELRLIAKAKKRDRRFAPDERARLREYFERRDSRAEIPMNDVLDFAIESTRRQAEICRLRWEDNDARTRTGLVRDAKHPFNKEGNHRRFKYTPEAWAIVQRQPRTSEYIFPYDAKSIGVAFTRACHMLQIPDLRFHDGRHEGTSRLFERGYQIHEVTQFTLHESWAELKRYANLRPDDVRELPPARKQPLAHSPARRIRRGRRVSVTSRAGGLSVPQDQQRSAATGTSVLPA